MNNVKAYRVIDIPDIDMLSKLQVTYYSNGNILRYEEINIYKNMQLQPIISLIDKRITEFAISFIDNNQAEIVSCVVLVNLAKEDIYKSLNNKNILSVGNQYNLRLLSLNNEVVTKPDTKTADYNRVYIVNTDYCIVDSSNQDFAFELLDEPSTLINYIYHNGQLI